MLDSQSVPTRAGAPLNLGTRHQSVGKKPWRARAHQCSAVESLTEQPRTGKLSTRIDSSPGVPGLQALERAEREWAEREGGQMAEGGRVEGELREG